MKTTLRCPKCSGKKLWIIDEFRVPGADAEGSPLAVVPHQARGRGGIFGSLAASPRGGFELYACAACGYSELWATKLDELEPGPGVRLIDTHEPTKQAFR